jgi:hypothetical protein
VVAAAICRRGDGCSQGRSGALRLDDPVDTSILILQGSPSETRLCSAANSFIAQDVEDQWVHVIGTPGRLRERVSDIALSYCADVERALVVQ